MHVARTSRMPGSFVTRALAGAACLVLCLVLCLGFSSGSFAAPTAAPAKISTLKPAGPEPAVQASGSKRWLDGEHFRYLYDADKVTDIPTVEQSAEAAYDKLSNLLDFTPAQRIPVVLYASRTEFQKDARVNRTEMVVGTASSADEAIRLDASKIFEAPDRVIGHEVTHIFLFQMLGDRIGQMPLWLNEGLAQEVGGADAGQAHAIVADALYHGRLIPLSQLSDSFPSGDTSLAYAEAQDATGDLLSRGGWPKMRLLLGGLKAGKTFDAAMQDVYGFGAADWDRRWNFLVRLQERSHAWMTVAQWIIPILMFIALVWGGITVRKHRIKQAKDEEPVPELEPPSWWREEDFR